jgi:hypothetical protein
MGGTVMEVKIEHTTPTKEKTYPYLAKDYCNRLCLVGKYSIIMIDPENDGDGYTHGMWEDNQKMVQEMEAKFLTPVRDMIVTLKV